MLASDIAIVREDARIGDNHSNIAMVPGGGSTQRLPRLVGRQRALGLILSGDHLSGAEAAAWGLAYRAVDELEPAVTAIAERLAAKDPVALARTKAVVQAGLERPLRDGIELELETVMTHLGSDG
jgi:enoyl-CoA hydratase